MCKYIVVAILIAALLSCVIDPVPGRITVFVGTDSTDYTVTVTGVYNDDVTNLTIEYPNTTARAESWHSDVYEYSYTIDDRDRDSTYLAGNIHIVHPNEYDFEDIKIE